ncbi:hypothetical protein M0812_17727 [Anaeramoeba flamelloides]|uniref:Stealth protein CR2 conserved region 2 domain-containing protein n=1 Tax=Anaeramoeba flamelloides TaxID=1746091 RepID=A0AAV7ZC67_9EUKA|nr:hypothetical protein M0812_17727 [Anaeramoeba flamelloides]
MRQNYKRAMILFTFTILFLFLFLSKKPKVKVQEPWNENVQEQETDRPTNKYQKEEKARNSLLNQIKEINSKKKKMEKQLRNVEKQRVVLQGDIKTFESEKKEYEREKKRMDLDEERVVIYDKYIMEDLEFEFKKQEYKVESQLLEIEKRESEIQTREEENEKRKRDSGKEDEYASEKKEIEEEKTKIENLKEEMEIPQKEFEIVKQDYLLKKNLFQDIGNIDVVYTWKGIKRDKGQDPSNRYNYELQYSLRSIDKYLPWVNKIYILMNSGADYPYWIKHDYPGKIRIIDQCELFESKEYCPSDNKFAAYSVAHRIPGLANKFILMDHDFFFNKPITRNYFYTRNDLPIIYETRMYQPTYRSRDELLDFIKEEGYPQHKYARYSHIPKPMRRDFLIRFDEKYPGYAGLIQSHLEPHNFLTEDYSMIYFEFLYKQKWMRKLNIDKAKFFQFPFSYRNNFKKQIDGLHDKLSNEDIITFSCKNNYDQNNSRYLSQRDILFDFFEKLYPNVPDYEITNPDHKKYS